MDRGNRQHLWARQARQRLAGGRSVKSVPEVWRAQRQQFLHAELLIRAFYLTVTFVLVTETPGWSDWINRDAIRPLWPIHWFDYVDASLGTLIVLMGSLTSALMAAALPSVRVCRLLVALFLLMSGALYNSSAGVVITYGFHGWFWTATIFVFLPDTTEARQHIAARQRYLQVFWSAQAALLLFYSLAGSFKLLGGIYQFLIDEPGLFSSESLARHIANRLLEGGASPPIPVGGWIISNPGMGAALLWGTVYFQISAIVVAFRPELHRIWAIALIILHLGIYFSMGILFAWQIALVGLLILCSPFVEEASVLRLIGQLPVLGDLITLAYARRKRNARELPQAREDSQESGARGLARVSDLPERQQPLNQFRL